MLRIIERNFLNLHTRINRLARKIICFSKSVLVHDTIIGLLKYLSFNEMFDQQIEETTLVPTLKPETMMFVY